jgi:hypothetical protein
MIDLFFSLPPRKSCASIGTNARVGPPCNHVFYCSLQCSKDDWVKYHAIECDFLKEFFMGIPSPLEGNIRNLDNFDNYTIDLMWLLMRILINRAKEISQGIDSDIFRQIWNMADNSSSFSPIRVAHFRKVAERLAVFVQQHLLVAFSSMQVEQLLPSIDEKVRSPQEYLVASLLSLVTKEECNSFGLYTFQYLGATSPRQSYALALYPSAVYFNHACTPNVIHVERDIADQKELHFYSLRDMKKGEEALISYVALESGEAGYTQKRRDFLKSEFCFDCDCERCANEINLQNNEISSDPFLLSILCRKDGCKGRLIPDSESFNRFDHKSMTEAGRTDSGNEITENLSMKWKCEACG